MNASADLTVSFFRAPVRGASPSYIRALVSAVLPLHSPGVQAWWQAADLDGGPADPTRPCHAAQRCHHGRRGLESSFWAQSYRAEQAAAKSAPER